VGVKLGELDGRVLGETDGVSLAVTVGSAVGVSVPVGTAVGNAVIAEVGDSEGKLLLGANVVGDTVGLSLGEKLSVLSSEGEKEGTSLNVSLVLCAVTTVRHIQETARVTYDKSRCAEINFMTVVDDKKQNLWKNG
jgi:hypothetical protein